MLYRLKEVIRIVRELWGMELDGWAGTEQKRISLVQAIQIAWSIQS